MLSHEEAQDAQKGFAHESPQHQNLWYGAGHGTNDTKAESRQSAFICHSQV